MYAFRFSPAGSAVLSATWPATLMLFPVSCTLVWVLILSGPEVLAQDNAGGVTPGFADPADTGKLPPFTNELAKKAANAVSRRDWMTAKVAYQEMLSSEPDNAATLSVLGAVEFEMGEMDAARGHLERAVQQRPKLASTWLTLGLIYYQQKDMHLALSAISRAVHERPNDPRARNFLAVVIKALGYTNGAETELQRAIELDPKYAEAHFNLALMYLERKPPATELASRHYAKARAYGAKPDKLVEKQLVDIGLPQEPVEERAPEK